MFESDLLGGFVFLHDFESKQIAKRRSEELREEFDRLVLLKWQTVARYGTGDEIEEARRNIDALQTKPKGGTKRALDGVGVQAKKRRMD